MQWRNLAIFIGLGLLAVTHCSEGRHSMRDRRETDYNDFAADEANDDDTQNDFEGSPDPQMEPPLQAKITTTGKVYEVFRGDEISLECHVDPEDAPLVTQWYKDNETYFMNTIKMANDIDLTRYYVGKDKSLNIQAVERSDEGVFRCEVVQAISVSVEHQLVVLSPPEITRFTATNDGNVMEGQDLLLTCEVYGKPPPQIMWSRIRINHEENERLSEADGEFSPNSLFMRGVKRDHSGKYYCYACNGPNKCDQSELQVQITGKPRVHVHRTVINSAVGVEALLECSTRYDANPHIRWYKDGVLIEDSSTDYVITTHSTHSNLTVTPRADKDFGTFTCEAENSMGRHNRSISLVQRPVVEALQAEDGRLAWTVHSHSPLQKLEAQLIFTRDDGNNTFHEFDVPLPSTPAPRYELIFDLNDKQLAVGKYQAVVKAENEYGRSEDVDPVIVEIVFRGNSAHSIQSSVVLSTILMYLLVRTL